MKRIIIAVVCVSIAVLCGYKIYMNVQEKDVLRKIITRLEADSRVAEVLVTNVRYDEASKEHLTTIKFLEYDVRGKPLAPRYFTFSGNIIQFQSLVIRFDDIHIRNNDFLKGKSAYLFWKVFMLDGEHTQEYELSTIHEIPQGYKVYNEHNLFEEKLWNHFWEYALATTRAKQNGVKNAQIEAPGTMFLPGILYTIKIEHDGGMRIDVTPLSPILRGEFIPA